MEKDSTRDLINVVLKGRWSFKGGTTVQSMALIVEAPWGTLLHPGVPYFTLSLTGCGQSIFNTPF